LRPTTFLALLPTPADAESAVNNLSEQGITERHISIVTANPADARAIIADGGPLAGVTASNLGEALTTRGLPGDATQRYSDGVAVGHALIAVAAPPAAAEMVQATLQDYNPTQTDTLPETSS
jgi:hypothetical protein